MAETTSVRQFAQSVSQLLASWEQKDVSILLACAGSRRDEFFWRCSFVRSSFQGEKRAEVEKKMAVSAR
jgi:hypothetical protein